MANALLLNANYPDSRQLGKRTYTQLNTNTGNAYISQSVAKNFQVDADTIHLCNNVWEARSNLSEIREASAAAPIVILILQDQLRVSFPDEQYQNALKVLRSLENGVPLVALSLGANSLRRIEPKDLSRGLSSAKREFFEYLSSRSLSLGVRGAFTAQVLLEMGIRNFEIVGCPSYFERGPNRTVENPRTRTNYRFVGTAGLQPAAMSQTYCYLQGDREWPFIELMHADTEFDAKAIAEGIKLNETNLRLLRDAPQECLQFFVNSDNWENHIRRHCQLVVGSRLHGSIAALNAGVPAIVTNPDMRARECCEFFGIPYRPEWLQRSDLAIEELVEAADPSLVNERYPALQERFASWISSFGFEIRTSSASSVSPLPEFERIDASILSFRAQEVLHELRKSAIYSSLLPLWFRREVAKFFCTMGVPRVGTWLYDRAEGLSIIGRKDLASSPIRKR